jgi:hypothetical protein
MRPALKSFFERMQSEAECVIVTPPGEEPPPFDFAAFLRERAVATAKPDDRKKRQSARDER